MKRFHTVNILDGFARFAVPVGKYIGLLIVASGVNKSGLAVSNSDLGLINVLKDGVQKHNVDFDVLQQSYDALEHGAVANSSSTGGSFNISAYLPFVFWKDGVALHVQNPDSWVVVHNFPGIESLVQSGTINYYGVKADDVDISQYELQLMNHHVTFSGAGTYNVPLRVENVHTLYIERDSNLTSLTVMKDGVPFYDNVPAGDVNVQTALLSFVEVYGGLPYLKVFLNPNDEDVGSFAKQVEVQFTVSDACTIKMLALSQMTTPDRLLRSVTSRNVSIEQKAQKPVEPHIKAAVTSKKISD